VNKFKNAATEKVSTDAQVQKGMALFKTKGCAGCHAIAGYATGNIGPNLTNFGLRLGVAADVLENTPANVEKWIEDPDSVKPSFMPDLGLSDADAKALTAYLESLGKQTKTAEASARTGTGGSNGHR
jgi:cytochrome c oxidase subunit 2